VQEPPQPAPAPAKVPVQVAPIAGELQQPVQPVQVPEPPKPKVQTPTIKIDPPDVDVPEATVQKTPKVPVPVIRLDPNEQGAEDREKMLFERAVIGNDEAMAARQYFDELMQWQTSMTQMFQLLASQQRELRDRVDQWMPHDVNPIEYS
jgi:hypothetical protein